MERGVPARFWSRRYGIVTLPAPARYAIAVAAAAVAVLVRLAFASLWGPFDLPFITFFPAVMVSAWLGGLGPGLLTTFLAAVLAKWFFIEPQYSFGLNNTADA